MKKFLAAIITTALLIINTTEVYAGVYGGKWANNPVYYIASTSVYYSEFNDAVATWNSTFNMLGISMQYSYTSSAVGANFIPSMSYYGDTGWNGWGEPGPDLYSGTYTYASVRLNRSYMDDFSSGKRTAIICHELGHVLGLSHNDFSNPHTLMYVGGSSIYYDVWGLSTPTYTDRTDLDSIY